MDYVKRPGARLLDERGNERDQVRKRGWRMQRMEGFGESRRAKRAGEQGGNSPEFRWKRGNVAELFSMSACSRHRGGRGAGKGAGSAKASLLWHVLSGQCPSVNLTCSVCGVAVPYIDTRLGVNAVRKSLRLRLQEDF